MDDGGTERGSRWGRLVLELAVVFVGVTAAFLVDEYRDERTMAQRRTQIVRALSDELEVVSSGLGEELPEFEAFVQDFAERLDRDERPQLVVFYPTLGFRGDMWDAAIAMGGVGLLDAGLVMRLSSFYGQVEAIRIEHERWERLTGEVLIPHLDDGPEHFYDEAGSLRPEYEWYARGLGTALRQSRTAAEESRKLADELRGLATQ